MTSANYLIKNLPFTITQVVFRTYSIMWGIKNKLRRKKSTSVCFDNIFSLFSLFIANKCIVTFFKYYFEIYDFLGT